jgi:transcriptional regulator with XRE-family HTH domain
METFDYLCIVNNSVNMEKYLAANMKFLRKKFGYNLYQMAALLSVSKSAISDYENAHSIPGFHLVLMYCKTFDVSLTLIHKVIFDEKNYESGLYKEQAVNHVPTEQFKELKMKYNILKQKTEGLEVQTKLMNQLLESKESENRTLKMQIELLMVRKG